MRKVTDVSRFSSVVTVTTSTHGPDVEQHAVGGEPGQGVAAGGEQPVPVGDEADEEEAGDQDEGRPVLGRRRPAHGRGRGARRRRRRPQPAAAGPHRSQRDRDAVGRPSVSVRGTDGVCPRNGCGKRGLLRDRGAMTWTRWECYAVYEVIDSEPLA